MSLKTSPKAQSIRPRVVLTFDDAVSNHATTVAPILERFGFGCTFYVTEFLGEGTDCFETDKRQYMDWRQIADLHARGFEIGNHTWHHPNLTLLDPDSVRREIEELERLCERHGIPTPRTFAYPGAHISSVASEIVAGKGYLAARGCENRSYRTSLDSLWNIPSFVITHETTGLFQQALTQAIAGETIIFVFHGIPDWNHPWVDLSPEAFESMMEALHRSGLPVGRMIDLRQNHDAIV